MQARHPRDESEFTEEEIIALAAMDMDDEDLRREQLAKEMDAFEAQLRDWRSSMVVSQTSAVPAAEINRPNNEGDDDTNAPSSDGEERDPEENNVAGEDPTSEASAGLASPPKRRMKKKTREGVTKRIEGNGSCHTTRKKPTTSSTATSRVVQPAVVPAGLLRMPAPKLQRGPLRGAQRRPFNFQDLIKAVLTPEERVGGSDAVADALAQVKIVELQDVNLDSSSLLELLGNMTHAYLQHNRLTELSGLELGIHLTVIILHHNQLTSLQGIAALPNVAVLDASYNLIQDLDPNELPSENLRSLNLRGNECSPSYKKDDAQDEAYVKEYRTALLSVCLKLSVLDDTQVTDGMREGLGLAALGGEPLLLEMVRADEEALLLAAMVDQESGMQTRVTDEDFLLGRRHKHLNGDGGGNSDVPNEGSGASGMDDDELREGDDDHEDTRRAHPASKSATPPARRGAGDGPSSGDDDATTTHERAGGSTAEAQEGVLVRHHKPNEQQHVSLTDRLLGQYERHSLQHVALLDDAVHHSNTLLAGVGSTVGDAAMVAVGVERFDPERKPVEDDEEEDGGVKRRQRVRQDDIDGVRTRASRPTGSDGKAMQDLSDVTQAQTLIRSELRKAMQHHSDVAQMMVSDHWHDAKETLRDRHLKAQERRYELRERLARPSAAYAEALETLSKECGDDLGRYRLEATTFAKDLASKKNSNQRGVGATATAPTTA